MLRKYIDMIIENADEDNDLAAPDSITTEDWGPHSAPLKLTRHDVLGAVSRGRAGIVNVRKIRAILNWGNLMVGVYEMVKGTDKVTVVDSRGNRYKVSSEEEAKNLMASWLP